MTVVGNHLMQGRVARGIDPDILVADHTFSDDGTATGTITVSSGRMRQMPYTTAVIKLLNDAADIIDCDRTTAKDYITRASALLQTESERESYTSGGLAPWQARRVVRHIATSLETKIRADDCARIARLSTS
jgi:hypothetical protein